MSNRCLDTEIDLAMNTLPGQSPGYVHTGVTGGDGRPAVMKSFK